MTAQLRGSQSDWKYLPRPHESSISPPRHTPPLKVCHPEHQTVLMKTLTMFERSLLCISIPGNVKQTEVCLVDRRVNTALTFHYVLVVSYSTAQWGSQYAACLHMEVGRHSLVEWMFCDHDWTLASKAHSKLRCGIIYSTAGICSYLRAPHLFWDFMHNKSDFFFICLSVCWLICLQTAWFMGISSFKTFWCCGWM